MQLALIGCSPRGERLAQSAQELGHTLAACADVRAAVSARIAKRFQARAAKSPVDALKDVEAVLVADPSPGHAATAVRALRAGIGVYWNAPLASDPKTAHRLLDAAKSAGAVLECAYPNRHCPQYAAAAAQTGSGSVGNIGFIRIHRRASTANHNALEALAGDLDFVAATFGPVETVYAQLVHSKSVNSALLTLTTGRGPIVQCACSLAPSDIDPAHATIELCGSAGMIQFDTHAPILSVRSRAAKRASTPVDSSPLTPSVVERRLDAFFASVAKGKVPAAQLRHELHVLRIVEAAQDSVRTGRAIKVRR